MTFKEYLASRRKTDTPAGDFAEDARRDSRLPDATTWEELRSYIERRAGRNVEAVREAGYAVWRGYQIKMRTVDAHRT